MARLEHKPALQKILYQSDQREKTQQTSASAFELGSGFRALDHPPAQLQEAQSRVVREIVALDQYQSGAYGSPLLEDIVEEARQAHRASYDAEVLSSRSTTCGGLFVKCCRLVGLIYGELVLFPSLLEVGAVPRLIRELHSVLDIVEVWVSEKRTPRLSPTYCCG